MDYISSAASRPATGARQTAAASRSFTGVRPKELICKDKTDAQQALLEDAAEEAAKLWSVEQKCWRSERAERWVTPSGWEDCVVAS